MTQLAYPSGLSPGSGAVSLSEFNHRLRPRKTSGFRDIDIHGLAFHSARVQPGQLFFAVRGTQCDGAEYAAHALSRGAVAIVSEQLVPASCPVLVVDDVRRALALAADLYYGEPSQELLVVGVTGTNGKTTVAHMVRSCLDAFFESKGRTGLIGTTGYEFGERCLPAINTTPDPVRLHGYMHEMVDEGCRACVMEVSSHGLVQERVHGIRFNVGAFLNLTQDHLDYHGDMVSYAQAKARLFANLEPGSHACICTDSDVADIMIDALDRDVNVHTFGSESDAETRFENVVSGIEGSRFEMLLPTGRVELMLHMPGLHNVHNAVAAASIATAMGVSPLTIVQALEGLRPVRGRLELAAECDGVRVYVDYAHTPVALEKVCATMRDLTQGRLLVVYGCGGDRDRSKRPQMTKAVLQHADCVYMTSDNPRSEDPEKILDDMEGGCADSWPQRPSIARIADRRSAIRAAVIEARGGDTVLIAGKGHETCQVMNDVVTQFDDCHEARKAMMDREAGT